MSEKNVEIVRGVYDAFARRDNAAPFAVYAPDIEWDLREGVGLDAPTVYHGHDGVRLVGPLPCRSRHRADHTARERQRSRCACGLLGCPRPHDL
jgi:ketosteroid isomerase-like protein